MAKRSERRLKAEKYALKVWYGKETGKTRKQLSQYFNVSYKRIVRLEEKGARLANQKIILGHNDEYLLMALKEIEFLIKK